MELAHQVAVVAQSLLLLESDQIHGFALLAHLFKLLLEAPCNRLRACGSQA